MSTRLIRRHPAAEPVDRFRIGLDTNPVMRMRKSQLLLQQFQPVMISDRLAGLHRSIAARQHQTGTGLEQTAKGRVRSSLNFQLRPPGHAALLGTSVWRS